MALYGQWCPIAKAMEIVGERWTLLVIRELLLGSRRFNELQRGLAKMSPSLLTKRLKELEDAGLVQRHPITGQKGFEYHLTENGRQLAPIIMDLGKWGLNWLTSQIEDDELDLDLLMLDMERNLHKDKLPPGKTIVKLFLTNATLHPNWWFILQSDTCDLCNLDPGLEPQLYLTTDTRTLTEVWMGKYSWQQAMQQEALKAIGPPRLLKEYPNWFGQGLLAAYHPDAARVA